MKKIFLILILAFFLSLAMVSAAQMITTDITGTPKDDFSPNELVFIHGSEFISNKIISVSITRPDSNIESGFALSDSEGSFIYIYNLDGIKGEYLVTATDGTNTAQVIFTDAAIWTTNGDCGTSQQDVNHYEINDTVFINGGGFTQDETFEWTITGKPGGASCDPNIVVASNNHTIGASGEFCLNAYTVQNDDCGEYQVKFGVKGDNYRVIGGECSDDEECGEPSSELTCRGNDIYNITETPACEGGSCIVINTTEFLNSCGSPTSEILCVGNNVTNITTIPACADAECINTTIIEIIETCELGCENAECLEPVCGDNVIEGEEECDDGVNNGIACTPEYESQCTYCSTTCEDITLRDGFCGDNTIDSPFEQCDDGNTNNNDSCRNDCTLPFCGDGVKDDNEQCDDGNNQDGDGCNAQCYLEFCGDNIQQPEEECDDGVNNGIACTPEYESQCTYCSSSCENITLRDGFCGDGTLDTQEQCDDGDTNNFDECRNDCTLPFCGDDIIDSGEQCEPPNTQTCDAECQIIKEECPDEDNDGVCDEDDDCPDSKPGEPVNEEGCDPFQFCEPLYCTEACFERDFIPIGAQPEENPMDCTVVVLPIEGVLTPRCVPLTCAN
nr:hypothetical protein [uncultured archaeon]